MKIILQKGNMVFLDVSYRYGCKAYRMMGLLSNENYTTLCLQLSTGQYLGNDPDLKYWNSILINGK